MKNNLYRFLLAMTLLTLGACNKDEILQKFASPQEQMLAKQYIRHLQLRQFEDIEKVVHPALRDPNLHKSLVQMADLIPVGEPSVVTLIGAQRHIAGDDSSLNLTYEYGFSGKWILTNVAVKKRADGFSIIGFSVIPQLASIEEINQFSMKGKSSLHYLMLTLAVVFPALTLLALVICARMTLRGRKWPWILFILTGFGTLTMNWTSGAINFIPVSLQLFSASASSAFYGPWIVSISLPIGALCFLIFRKNHAAVPVTPSDSA